MDAPKPINKEYKVIGNQQVKLTVMIGDGQQGDPVVMLDSQLLKIGNITGLNIGYGDGIKGKKLYVKTVVNDVNPKTNHTSIVYILEGGESTLHEINEGTIGTNGNGGSMVYRDQFNFA